MEYFVYTKFKGDKSFKATDINEGRQVGNLIYATLLENTPDNQQKLQRLADLNADLGLKIQLRDRHKVCFETV